MKSKIKENENLIELILDINSGINNLDGEEIDIDKMEIYSNNGKIIIKPLISEVKPELLIETIKQFNIKDIDQFNFENEFINYLVFSLDINTKTFLTMDLSEYLIIENSLIDSGTLNNPIDLDQDKIIWELWYYTE
jgi:hypothetical protein